MFALRVWQIWLSLLSQTEEWTMLSDALASILITGCNTLATTLCYICVGHIDKTVEVWLSLRTKRKGNPMLIFFRSSRMKFKLYLCAHGFGCRWSTAPAHFFSTGAPSSSVSDWLKGK